MGSRALGWPARWALGGALAALALGAPAAEAATCHLDQDGVALTLEIGHLAPEDWGPWCRRLWPALQLGAPLPEDASRLAEERLAQLGYFRKIACRHDPGRLRCMLMPQAIVTRAEVRGKLPFSVLREDVRRRLSLRPGTLLPAPEAALAQQRDRLTKALRQEGFLDAQVTMHLALDPDVDAVPNIGVRLEAQVSLGPPFAVRHIELGGDRVVGRQQVEATFRPTFVFNLRRGRFRPGHLVEQARALEDHLQGQGYPAAVVRVRTVRLPGRPEVDLQVQVQAGPWTALSFAGNRVLTSRQLVALSTFREAGAVDGQETEHSLAAWRTAYQERGYDQVQITQDIRPRPGGRVAFTVEEGPRRSLVGVHIGRPGWLPERWIRQALAKEGGLGGHVWVDARAEQAASAVQEALQRRGLREIEVQIERRPDPARPERSDLISAWVEVQAKPALKVAQRVVVGLPAAVPQAPLLARLQTREGAAFVPGAAEADRDVLQAILVSEGFVRTEVEAHVEPVSAPGQGDQPGQRVTFVVRPGLQARFAGLLVRGRVRSRLDVVEDEVRLDPHDPLQARALVRAQRRLMGFNFFNSVDTRVLLGDRTRPEAALLVALQERGELTVDALVEFSTDNLFALGGTFTDRNLWGRAVDLNVDLRLADAPEVVTLGHGKTAWPLRLGNQDRLTVQLRTPHPFGAPFDLIARGQGRYADYPRAYRYHERVGEVAAVRQLLNAEDCGACPTITARLGYRLSTADLDDKAPGQSPAQRLNLASQQTVGRLAPSIEVEGRDTLLDPRRGYFLNWSIEYAHPWLAGPLPNRATPFVRSLQRLHVLWPLWRGARGGPEELRRGRVVLATSAALSMAWHASAERRPLPSGDAFAYGGDLDVRGLMPGASTAQWPRTGPGQALFMSVLNAELRWYVWPVGIGTVQLGGFADLGTVAPAFGGLFEDCALSAGPVLRYVTQVGPLSLAYARMVTGPAALRADPSRAPRRGRVHFMFGYAF